MFNWKSVIGLSTQQSWELFEDLLEHFLEHSSGLNGN